MRGELSQDCYLLYTLLVLKAGDLSLHRIQRTSGVAYLGSFGRVLLVRALECRSGSFDGKQTSCLVALRSKCDRIVHNRYWCMICGAILPNACSRFVFKKISERNWQEAGDST